MKNPKEFLDNFPEARDEIEHDIHEMRQINAQIENLRKDPGLQPTLKPDWAPKFSREGNQAHNRIILEQRKEAIRKEMNRKCDLYFAHVEPENREMINQYIEAKLEKGLEDKEADKPDKEISIAQKLKDSLPLSKYRKAAELSQTKEKVVSKEDNEKNFSVANELKNSLWSSKVRSEAEKFSNNKEEITKHSKDREKE